jgi:hypothetical protein
MRIVHALAVDQEELRRLVQNALFYLMPDILCEVVFVSKIRITHADARDYFDGLERVGV